MVIVLHQRTLDTMYLITLPLTKYILQSLGVHGRPMGSTIIVHCLGFPWFSTGDHKVHTLVVKSGNMLLPVSLDG